MKRLALSNSRVTKLSTFKDILSDLATAPLEDKTSTFLFNQLFDNCLTPKTPLIDGLAAASLKNSKKKRAKSQTLSGRLSKKFGKEVFKSSISLLVTMELIRSGKKRIKISANAVKSTTPKCMRQLTIN